MIAVIIRKYPIKLGIYRSIVSTVTSRVRPGEVETGFVGMVSLGYVENAKINAWGGGGLRMFAAAAVAVAT